MLAEEQSLIVRQNSNLFIFTCFSHLRRRDNRRQTLRHVTNQTLVNRLTTT
jgi:hypothetical protein